MRVLLNIAKAYAGQKKDEEALSYAHESLSMSQQAGAIAYILEAYKLLPQLYKRLGKNDSAYSYLQQYKALEDSVLPRQFLWKLSNYKKSENLKRQTDSY